MAKIIKLTESDLRRIVKKVIKEQKSFISEGNGSQTSPFLDQDIQPDVNIIVDDLDGWVNGSNLDSIYRIIMKYNNKFASDYTNPNQPVTVPALKRLTDLYKMDENGDDLLRDLNQVGTRTLPNSAMTKKMQVINVLNNSVYQNRTPPAKMVQPQPQGSYPTSQKTTTTPGGTTRKNAPATGSAPSPRTAPSARTATKIPGYDPM